MIKINISDLKVSNTYSAESDYLRVNKYPDGQKDVSFNMAQKNNWINVPEICIIHNEIDPFFIASAVASLKSFYDGKISLYVPYTRGSRSDRTFVDGGSNYVGKVVCPFIDSLGIDTFITYDAHNDNAFDVGLRTTKFIDLKPYAHWERSLTTIDKKYEINSWEDIIVIAPDDNAAKKIEKGFKALDIEIRIVSCTKRRNEKGEVIGTKVLDLDNSIGFDTHFVLIDDIGDGFGTFIKIAEELTASGFNNPRHLVVSHIIQQSGLMKALDYFETVHCTDSTGDWGANAYVTPIFGI